MNWIQNATYFKFSPHVKKISVRETSNKSLLFNFAFNFHSAKWTALQFIGVKKKQNKEFPVWVKFPIMQDGTKGFYNYCAHEAQRFIINKFKALYHHHEMRSLIQSRFLLSKQRLIL